MKGHDRLLMLIEAPPLSPEAAAATISMLYELVEALERQYLHVLREPPPPMLPKILIEDRKQQLDLFDSIGLGSDWF